MQLKRITICVALAFAPGAFAAEATEASLPDVKVIGERVQPLPAYSNSALGGIDITHPRTSTSDTAKLLDGQPGVSLSGAGGVSSLPVVHGLADDRVRIKVDGMDLISSCANHMNPALSYIDPSNVGSIKVFAGITPVSVGGDSIGGTILVDSQAPEFARAGQSTLMKGQVSGFYRSNGNAQGGNLAATIAGEKLSVTYNGSTAQSDNYDAAKNFKASTATQNGLHTLPLDEVGSTAYKATNHALGFALRHENHLVELKLGLQDIPYQGFPNQHMDMTGNDSKQINLRYTGQYQWGALEARAYNEKTRHKMDFYADKRYWFGTASTVAGVAGVPCAPISGTAPTCAAGMPMDTEGKTTGTLVKADILLSERDIIRVGGEYQRYRLSDWWDPSGGGMWPNTFWNINNGERDRLDFFGEWETNWNPQLLSQLGVRSDTVKMNTGTVQGYNTGATYATDAAAFNASNRNRTDHNWDLTALARYTPDDSKAFEFGFAQKTRSPNLYERYIWSTGGMAMAMNNLVNDGNAYVGNLSLKPEVAHTLSATADWHDAAQEQWGLKITPYYTHVQDYVDAERCSATNAACVKAAPNSTTTTQFVSLRFVNQSARIYGMDVSGHFPLAKAGDYGSFTAKGALNYTDGKNQTTGDNLYNIMPLNAKLAVVQQWGNWTNTVEGHLVDAKTKISQVRNEMKTGGYGLLNLRSSYEWKQVRVDVGVENILDKFYAMPLGGAYIGQGSTMSINGANAPYGVPVPGIGRSIYAGATLKF